MAEPLIRMANIRKSYGRVQALVDANFHVNEKEIVGLLGDNGAGKSTLIKVLSGAVPLTSGDIFVRGKKVNFRSTSDAIAEGIETIYQDSALVTQLSIARNLFLGREPIKPPRFLNRMDQDSALVTQLSIARNLFLGREPIKPPRFLNRMDQEAMNAVARDLLRQVGITKNIPPTTPIGSLSGGERSRLLLAREFARAANLLVLDEPTNDLDLETLDLLQEVIADYEGTVLIVSHDRDFLDRTVTITLGLDGSGKVDIVAGGYEDWVRKRYEVARSPAKTGTQGGTKATASGAPGPRAAPGIRKLSYKDQRDYDRLPGEIDRLQEEVTKDEEALSDPDLYTRDPERFAKLTERIARHRADIEAAELRWLEVAEMAEQLNGA